MTDVFAFSNFETKQNPDLGNINTKDKDCSWQGSSLWYSSESEMFDENEDIALTYCDEKNINYITTDNYVARNDCKTEFNS